MRKLTKIDFIAIADIEKILTCKSYYRKLIPYDKNNLSSE